MVRIRQQREGGTQIKHILTQRGIQTVLVGVILFFLPETEIARTPLLTASNFFSLLDSLDEKKKKKTVKKATASIKLEDSPQ